MPGKNNHILLVAEQTNTVCHAFCAGLEQEATLHRTNSVQQALMVLQSIPGGIDAIVVYHEREHETTALVLLQKLKQGVEFRNTPVLVLSEHIGERGSVLEKGAADFVLASEGKAAFQARLKKVLWEQKLPPLMRQGMLTGTQQELHGYLTGVPFGLVVFRTESDALDAPLTIDYINEAFAELCNISAAKLHNGNLQQVFASLDPDLLDICREVALTGGNRCLMDEIGSEKAISFCCYQPRLRYCVCVAQDITELRQLQRENDRMEQEQIELLEEQLYRAQHDELTGVYRKSKFLKRTEEILTEAPDTKFVFIQLDIHRFGLVNSFFGMQQGDELLQYVGAELRRAGMRYAVCSYGRIRSDVFGMCVPYQADTLAQTLDILCRNIKNYNRDYNIRPCFGLYIIETNALPMEHILVCAELAANQVKANRYGVNYLYYTKEMGRELLSEQQCVQDLHAALQQEQFEIFLQPKCNIRENRNAGAEALVRWRHPRRGLLTPNQFIPAFERNGFILQLDLYVWNKTCALLKKWIDEGQKPNPISVNISRVDLYNPKIDDIIIDLVDSYNLPHELLELELTETSYTDDPIAMKKIVARLQRAGFKVLMDDFGSGYSSLNMLKDISVDVLKTDIRFLAESEVPGRGENILGSIIRMAKWLCMPIVVEGVENERQLRLLRSLGGDYAQGYYFAKPMPVAEYEEYLQNHQGMDVALMSRQIEKLDPLSLRDPQLDLLFDTLPNAVAIYELFGDSIEMLRVNQAFIHLMGETDIVLHRPSVLSVVEPVFHQSVREAFHKAVEEKSTAECVYLRQMANGEKRWIQIRLNYVAHNEDRQLLYGALTDVTDLKQAEARIEEQNWVEERIYKAVPCGIAEFDASGKMRIYQANHAAIEMLGYGEKEFWLVPRYFEDYLYGEQKEQVKQQLARISENHVEIIEYPLQNRRGELLWIHDSVKRLKNEKGQDIYQSVLTDLTRQKDVEEQLRDAMMRDALTGLYNRKAFEQLVADRLRTSKTGTGTFMMLDIDNFKQANDKNGHLYGDVLLIKAATLLQNNLRDRDIIARLGGDEFAAFLPDVDAPEIARQRGESITYAFSLSGADQKKLTCSIGIAFAPVHGTSFAELYIHADQALYSAKKTGKNCCALYQPETAEEEREEKEVSLPALG